MIRAIIVLVWALSTPFGAEAQESGYIFKAEVIEVGVAGVRANEGTALSSEYQELSVRLLDGARKGEVVSFTNDSPFMVAEGDVAYIRATTLEDGNEVFAVLEPDRLPVLAVLGLMFVLFSIALGGMAGLRSIISLILSFGIIIFVLLPLLVSGAPPVLTSTLLAGAILVLSMVITHGARKETWVALLGSLAALLLAVVVAEVAVATARLSGFASDEAVYLNFATNGTLDIAGLLLGSILIGIVGVLNDISVSQVHTVSELITANPSLSRKTVLFQAMRVGREHLGAVINTLPLAYAGAALPLLLLFSTTTAPFLFVINREVFASELVRILAGGIALSVSGAIATLLAVLVLLPRK
jgi:uncharacterized membrane protein